MDTANPSEESVYFPNKPVFQTKAADPKDDSWKKSLLSIAIFMVAFYFVFDQDIRYVMIIVVVLLIHELGHFAAMRFFDYKDVRMFFVPLLGAFVTGRKEKVSQKQRAIVLLAGPVPGILIGFVLYAISMRTDHEVLSMMGLVFLLLNIFNLIPLAPLDGGHLIHTLFFSRRNTLQAIFIIISGLGLTLLALYLESYFLLIIPALLFFQLRQYSRLSGIRANMQAVHLDYKKSYEELSNQEYWLMRAQVVRYYKEFEGIDPAWYRPCGQENQIMLRIRAILTDPPVQDLSFWGKSIFVGAWLMSGIGPVIALTILYVVNNPLSLSDSPEVRQQLKLTCILDQRSDTIMARYPDRISTYCDCLANTLTPAELEATLINRNFSPDTWVDTPHLRDCVTGFWEEDLL